MLTTRTNFYGKLLYFLLLSFAICMPARAATFYSFTGTFSSGDQVELFEFTIAGATETVTIESWAYGGGTNAAGALIPSGGFDSLFTLFDGTGSQIGIFDDCAGLGTSQNGGTNGCLDAYYTNTLSAGTYTLALTQAGNFPNGDLSDGFSPLGLACPPAGFCDGFGDPTTGAWAVDFLFVNSDNTVSHLTGAAIPEPATWLLTSGGIALLGLMRRRKDDQNA